jgi:hypothetical protein
LIIELEVDEEAEREKMATMTRHEKKHAELKKAIITGEHRCKAWGVPVEGSPLKRLQGRFRGGPPTGCRRVGYGGPG